jgi:hypothetical protein
LGDYFAKGHLWSVTEAGHDLVEGGERFLSPAELVEREPLVDQRLGARRGGVSEADHDLVIGVDRFQRAVGVAQCDALVEQSLRCQATQGRMGASPKRATTWS